uniref:Uncharacterized protein n=1 Tax=Anguilla anguilla TaxID=7936 RepID=A0A0E9UHY1_ANGAN
MRKGKYLELFSFFSFFLLSLLFTFLF